MLKSIFIIKATLQIFDAFHEDNYLIGIKILQTVQLFLFIFKFTTY